MYHRDTQFRIERPVLRHECVSQAALSPPIPARFRLSGPGLAGGAIMVSALSSVYECPIRCHPQRDRIAARRRVAGGAMGDWRIVWGLQPGLAEPIAGPRSLRRPVVFFTKFGSVITSKLQLSMTLVWPRTHGSSLASIFRVPGFQAGPLRPISVVLNLHLGS